VYGRLKGVIVSELAADKLETMLVIGDDYVVLKFVFETLKNAKCAFSDPVEAAALLNLPLSTQKEATCFFPM
jgi:hypothetical protein